LIALRFFVRLADEDERFLVLVAILKNSFADEHFV
jgi:hypothetical protein